MFVSVCGLLCFCLYRSQVIVSGAIWVQIYTLKLRTTDYDFRSTVDMSMSMQSQMRLQLQLQFVGKCVTACKGMLVLVCR